MYLNLNSKMLTKLINTQMLKCEKRLKTLLRTILQKIRKTQSHGRKVQMR